MVIHDKCHGRITGSWLCLIVQDAYDANTLALQCTCPFLTLETESRTLENSSTLHCRQFPFFRNDCLFALDCGSVGFGEKRQGNLQTSRHIFNMMNFDSMLLCSVEGPTDNVYLFGVCICRNSWSGIKVVGLGRIPSPIAMHGQDIQLFESDD